MAIEDILRGLDVQADAQIEGIRKEAQTKADAITSEAQEKAKRAADAYIAGVVSEQMEIAERELHAVALAHRRKVADLRREVFEKVFEQAAREITTIRERADYPKILARLVADATGDMEEGYILHVDPRDKELVSEVCRGMACAADIKTAGGVVVTSSDGRIRRSSTFEDRLQRIQEEHIGAVSEVLDS